MAQMNLSMTPVTEGMIVNNRAVTKSQAEKYNAFYKRTFSEVDVDELLEEGGGENLNNFKIVSKKLVKDKGYYEAMFPSQRPTFVGRDGKVRESKLSGRLGEIVFKMLPEDQRTVKREYTRNNKNYEVYAVRKGKTVTYKDKQYKGGWFLPKGFFNQ